MSVVLNLDTEAIQITGIASGGAGTLSDGGFKNCFAGVWVYRDSAIATYALTDGGHIIHFQSGVREVALGFNSTGVVLADLNLQMIYNSGGGAGTSVLFTGYPGDAYLDEWVYYFIAENPTDGQIAGYIRAADLATAITLSRANDNATSQYINTLTFGNFSGNTAVVAGRYAYGRAAYDAANGFNVADALAFAASAVPTGDWGFWRLANNTDTADTSGNGRTITFVGTLDTAGDPPLAVPQFARPASDNVDGSWTPSTGGDLFACIDETPFSDTDYISATANTSGKVNLPTLSTPAAGTQTARLRASGSPAKRLIARLIEGASTVRGSVTVDPLTSTVTAYSFSPSGISNYADLDFEFEIQDATSPPANNPSYNALGAAANVTSTTTVNVNYPSMTGANSSTALYLIATGRSNTAATEFAITGGGWTIIGTLEGGTGTWGADAGTRRVTVFRKDTVTGSESGTVTLTLAGTTANTLYASIVRVDAPAAGYTLTQSVVSGADTSAGTGVSITASSTLTYAANDLILVCHASPSDTGGVVGSPSLTASGSTFGSLTSRASIAVTGGNDHRHVVYSAVVTAAGSAAAPVFAYTASGTNSGNASGPAVFVRIRSTAPTEFARVTFAEFEVPAAATGGSFSDSSTEAAAASDASTAIVIYNATSSEAAAASEVVTSPGGPQSDSVTEAVVLSETQSSTFSTSASATEAAAAADASGSSTGNGAAATESASASEASAAAMATLAARVEAASASEASAAAMATLAARVEAASAAESATGQAARGASVTEPAAASEQSSTSGLSQNDSVTETATAAEAGAATFTTSATRTEAGAAAETSNSTKATTSSATEAGAASETAASSFATSASSTEAASATDTSVTDAGTSDSVSEAAAASDASASTYSTQAARLEAASAAEASIAGAATSASRLEAGAASEDATGTASRNAAVTETAAASDSTVAFSVRVASVTEIAAIIDASNGSAISPTSDSVTESAAAADNSAATSARTDGVVESASASEASLGRWLTSSSVSEAAAASEQSTGMRTQYTSVTEVASLSELSSLLVAFAVSRVEAGAASEVINVVAFVGGSVTESGALAEMVVGSVGIETIYEPVTATDVVSALRALDAAGMRVYAVAAEDRLYVVEGEDRSVEFPSEDRGVAL